MIDKGLNWIDKALNIIEKYKFTKILKAVGVIVIVMLTVKFIENPTYIFEKYKEWEEIHHNAALEKRMLNNNKIQVLCEKLLYKVNANRVVVLELHNGLTSNGNLPFAKCTASYEALNDGAAPISQQYQNTNLSLMPFVEVLFANKYWCGDTKELRNTDKGLYYKLMSNGTEHFACAVIQGVNKPLALLMVSFEEVINNHNCKDIESAINSYALELALLMEIRQL